VQVRTGKEKFIGYAREAKSRDSITPIDKIRSPDIDSWEDLSEHLNASIDRIGGEICRGHAIVDPMPGVCDRCDLSALCRISRWRDGLNDSEGGDTESDPDVGASS